jgi:serine/threonine protein phosphatase 1
MDPSREVPVARLDLRDHAGRCFVVGDLHGMAHALERLLDLAGFDAERDLVWSLGDLVDRGPFSPQCLALLDEPWFRAIRGNHEQLMLDAAADPGTWLIWILNGGDWSPSYPWDGPALRRKLAALPWAAELHTAQGRVGLVHADLDLGLPWHQFLEAIEGDLGQARGIALWSRTSVSRATRGLPGPTLQGVDLVLLGHSIVDRACQWGSLWFLDSGAVVSQDPTAALSMLEVHPERRLWTVPTAFDPVVEHWWSGRRERVAAAVNGGDGPPSDGRD